MKLIFLSLDNLRDQYFLKMLVSRFSTGTKFILVHDHFGSELKDTRFVTRRISSMLSETMIVNNGFSGDQMNLISSQENDIVIDVDRIEKLLTTVQGIILNPITAASNGPFQEDAIRIISQIRIHYPDSELVLFPKNSKSPLVAERAIIKTESDRNRFLKTYDEEFESLELAYRLAPAVLASPENFLQ